MNNQKKKKVIISQGKMWGAGLIKDRENRYKSNFWKKNDMMYIKNTPIKEMKRRLEEHDNVEIKTDFFWSEETGPLTKFHGKPSLRMLIDNERVITSSRFKKFIYVFLQEMVHSRWYEKLGILLSMRKLRNIYLESVYRGVSEYLIDPRYITPPVKEIRRCIEKVMPGNGEFEWEGYYSDPPCFFLEYDPAYRYPLQDILSEVNKEECIKQGGKIMSFIRLALWFITKKDFFLYKATKEVKRLTEILLERDWAEENRWGKLPKLTTIIIQLFPYIRNKFCEFIQELDINKIEMNQYDRYWGYQNKGYNYKGLNQDLRDKIIKEAYKEYDHTIKK